VSIGFEASCGGGIPFITALQHNLIANRIEALYGILNGTCNYILTQMISNGVAYDQALADAQQRGYAEADPTLDVGGGDTAHKLAVLASLAFGVSVTDQQVPCRGIDTLDLADVRWGAELGYQVKLLAIAERREDGLTLSVAPCFIDRDEPLAGVKDSFNAISVFGHAVGHTMYYGRGAGQMPTASAVVGDIMNIASGGYGSLFKTAAIWPDQQPPAQLLDSGALASRFYLRVNAMDRPGVLARIAEALGAAGISIAAVSQHEQAAGQFVPVVIITHEARAGDVASAIEQVQAMDITEGQPIAIRIVDLPEG
jgi:homoserine dehydrogenase